MSDINSLTPYFDITIPYLIGVDVAAGGNGDNTALCIVHPYTFEVVGELLSPFIGTIDLMRIITEVAKLCPRGIFCVETNSIGKAIVDFVQETELEHRFYHDPKLDISKNATQKETPEMTVKRKAVEKGYIGTYVTPTVRKNMFDLLKTQMHDYRHLVLSKFLVKDITNLVKGSNGKIEAADGFHDDMVMAYNHVLYVFYYGHRLERFGIDKQLCTFKSARTIINEYVEELNEEQVNNMVAYKNPDAYENQLLNDLTSSDPMGMINPNTHRDEYGYKREEYNAHLRAPEPEALSIADMSFYYDVNNVF